MDSEESDCGLVGAKTKHDTLVHTRTQKPPRHDRYPKTQTTLLTLCFSFHSIFVPTHTHKLRSKPEKTNTKHSYNDAIPIPFPPLFAHLIDDFAAVFDNQIVLRQRLRALDAPPAALRLAQFQTGRILAFLQPPIRACVAARTLFRIALRAAAAAGVVKMPWD